MNLDTVEEIRSAIYEQEDVYTESSKAILFKCIERAKWLKDLDLEFEARYEYLSQLTYLGYFEESISLFPWFLNIYDQYPDQFNYYQILWGYKWIVGPICKYANIPLAKVEAIFADFNQRFKDYGSTERIVAHFNMRKDYLTGNVSSAIEKYYQSKNITQEHFLDDCDACMLDHDLPIFLYNREFQTFLDEAKPILDRNLSCRSVPKTTYPKAVYACMQSNKWDLAEQYCQAALDELELNKRNFEQYCYVLLYLATQNKYIKGREIIENQLSLMNDRIDNVSQCTFYHACYLFFQHMKNEGQEKVTLRLALNPAFIDKFIKADKDEVYDISELVSWFKKQAELHAKALDQRNGNTFYQDDLIYISDVIKN